MMYRYSLHGKEQKVDTDNPDQPHRTSLQRVVEEGGSGEGTRWSSDDARRGRRIEALCGPMVVTGFGGGRLYLIDASYGAYFRTEAEEDVDGSIRKRKRKPKVVGAPSGVDWDVARNMISYLKIFSDVTTKISGSKYVTSNIFFSELVKMQATITRMTLSQDEQKKKMAISMKTNKEMVGKVTKTLDELFNHYKGKTENPNGLNSQDTLFGEKSSISEMDVDLELNFDKLDDGGQDIKSEVEIYLGDAREKRDQKFDLLGWWKTNSIKFPILSKLARNILAMSISTAASKSTFSTGGRVIDKYRSSLNPETVEALIYAQD
ncbi:hypothetical protein LXL04_002758 [Taraxacum kok-saghyz]